MPEHPRRLRYLLLALIPALLAGCAGGPTPRTTIGTLKTSLAQLEHQNEQYRRQIAELETNNRRLADELAQERQANVDLASRLDDARTLLDRGPSTDARTAGPESWSDPLSRTNPSLRSSRPARKPPFAQIKGSITTDPDQVDEDEEIPDPVTLEPAGSSRPRSNGRPAGPSGARWLPIAGGVSEPSPARR